MSDEEYERIKSEIEIVEERLKEDIVEKEIEAETKINEILSKKKMEFCTRCGSKVESSDDWGGKCLYDDCNNLICKKCWIIDEKRFCKKHAEMVLEESGKKKMFFKEEKHEEVKPVEEKPAEIKTQIYKEDRVNKIKNLTEKYTEFMKERVHKFGVPDWIPFEFIKKVKFSVKTKEYGKLDVIVYKKGWIFKKAKLQILIRPLILTNMDELMPEILEKIGKIYTDLVFVSDKDSVENVKSLFEKAVYQNASLFLIDAETNKLYFNPESKVAEKYSCWFDPKQNPLKFRDILKAMSDMINDRLVIGADKLAKQIGSTDEQAFKMLKKCNFLSQIKGTNSFLFKHTKIY